MILPYRWLYIDFNSYFASVEQQITPALRGKPIAVISVATDATSVIAASYEAKAFGIKAGTPVYEAKKICRSLICVVARHENYMEFHHRIIQEVGRHLPISKVCSIDEVACELMDNENSVEKATQIAQRIKQGLAERVGAYITCSIGIAPNCYLAKVATDMQKPNGLVFLSAAELPQKLYVLKLRDLPGIGPKMEERLRKHGICDMQTLCSLDVSQMRRAWGGVLGERMWFHLRGIPLPDLATERTTLSHSSVLAPELREPGEAEKIAKRLALKCAARLRKEGLICSMIALEISWEKGGTFESFQKCGQVSDSITILQAAKALWPQGKEGRIKKVSVTLSQLAKRSDLTIDLFDSSSKGDQISSTLDYIQQRYRKDAISLGF